MKSASFFLVSFCTLFLMAAHPSPARATYQSKASDETRGAYGPVSHAVPAGRPEVKFGSAYAVGAGGYYGSSVATADLNGDGKLDLVLTSLCQSIDDCDFETEAGAVSILLGNGNGTFQEPLVYNSGGTQANSVAIADVNGDGRLDLVIANSCEGSLEGCVGEVSVLLGNGDGTFQPATIYDSGGLSAVSVAIGDVNGDGHPDIVVANSCGGCIGSPNGVVSVLLGNEDGTFGGPGTYDAGGFGTQSIAIADLNGDGQPDLVVANNCQDYSCEGDGVVGVLMGNGDGTFQPVVGYSSGGDYSRSVAIGDLNGDGIPDLVVVGSSLGVLLGNGDGTFRGVVTYGSVGFSVAIGDVNGDGYKDVVTADGVVFCGYEYCQVGQVSVLAGNGDGTLQAPVTYYSKGWNAVSVVMGDINGDGRLDLLIANECAQLCGNPAKGVQDSVGLLFNVLTTPAKIAFTSSPNPSQANQSVTFKATITATPSIPSGESVNFYNGATKIGTATIAHGIATLTTSFSTAGKYTIEAKYPGDAFHKASSKTEKQVVNP